MNRVNQRGNVLAAALCVGWAITAGGLLIGCGKGETKIAAENCQRVLNKIAAGKNESLPFAEAMAEFDRMKLEAETGIVHCKKAGMTDAIAALEKVKLDIERQKEAGKEAAAKNAAMTASSVASADAAKKEAEWPTTQEWIRNRLVEAKTAADARDWALANAKLMQARDEFATLTGTKVQGTPQWTAVKQEISAVEKRVQPHVPQPTEAKSGGSAATDARGPKPDEVWFDGCNMTCRKGVKAQMHDPDSFECVTSTLPQAEGDYWTVVMRYRGSNMVGAKVLTTSKCFIQNGEVMRIQ
jgi:hypothetical protein